MCLHPEEIPPIPDETVRVAKAAFPKGNLYMRLRDELGVFYQDEDFALASPIPDDAPVIITTLSPLYCGTSSSQHYR
ncbi:hypothetical protein [Nostoc sp. MG11]|uniref:hypothetical protein n=1 Tax=Nostoc sp. MG11 TaxID=2721166 RepID=UPI00186789AD|nr:hypothetical protein [Nostoc sp. MG11]